MKKIPTLFVREYSNHKVVGITPETTEGMECVLNGECVATIKIDGSACAIINGELYKRYDAKKGKKIPEGAIKCQDEPDPVTGHLPCWVKCSENNPADRWFIEAFQNSLAESEDGLIDGTYEAVGKHFQGNPYGLETDCLRKHGRFIIHSDELELTFDGIKDYLNSHYIEGIVFWNYGRPICKIKRSDFGFEWGKNKAELPNEKNYCYLSNSDIKRVDDTIKTFIEDLKPFLDKLDYEKKHPEERKVLTVINSKTE